MLAKSKKILTITGIAVAGLLLLGYNKYKEAQLVLSHITFGITNISNVKLKFSKVAFDAIVSITNPTNIDFGATATSKIAIKQIRIFTKNGTYVGKADTRIYEINLPARQTVNLPKITFEVDTLKAVGELSQNLQSYLNYDFSNLKYKIDVEAFGKIVTLEA